MTAQKHFRLGVFMPVGNNGWIMSRNAPQYAPTYQINKDIVMNYNAARGTDYP